MKNLLEKLFAGEKLSQPDAFRIMEQIGSNEWNNSQLASFLTVFRMRPITHEELAGFRNAMFEMSTKVSLEPDQRIDVVGTGGDGKNSFNISTLSCFVIAGAGYKVSKHGNYGASSVSGSSNVLLSLGYEFSNDPEILQRQLDRANFTFMHAPLFHPAMKYVAPVRKELEVRTFFNYLGPLLNPSDPECFLLGVNDRMIGQLYEYVLNQHGKRFHIVHSVDGFDEISLTDATVVISSQDGGQTKEPKDFGFTKLKEEELSGGDSLDSAKEIFLNVLENKGTPAQKNVVLANAALGIQTINPTLTYEDATNQAKESLESGKAFSSLKTVIDTK